MTLHDLAESIAPKLRVISLGAGVQSTTMALMAAHGEIGPMPDCAIFADTQWEPAAVYKHLDWLEGVLPFPVHRVTAGNLREKIIARQTTWGGRFSSIPWHIVNPDGSHAMGQRACTKEFKIEPIMREVRRLLGVGMRDRIAPGTVELWIGISTDEAARMKPAAQKYMTNCWPLIDARMSRWDCLRWLERKGHPKPAKSSCIGCPFHNDAHWREMRNHSPAEWADAVAVDRALRGDARGFRGTEYMHPSRKPLDEVDLSTAEDRGQLNLFNNECEGMCGV